MAYIRCMCARVHCICVSGIVVLYECGYAVYGSDVDEGEGSHDCTRAVARGVEIAHTAENAQAQPSNL